jgi:hypothetical protein
MIVYYFPPLGMGGVQRPLKFAKYLPEFGWDVSVITPHPSSYYHSDDTLLAELPDSIRVERIAAPGPAEWLADRSPGLHERLASRKWARTLKGWLHWPDDKRGFAARAVSRARNLMRERAVDIVWTSSPPPSIHLAGMRLQPRMGWIADFRDPWFPALDDWGPSPLHVRYGRRLRQRIARSADRLVVDNEILADILDQQGPAHPATVIHNGYDEADFTELEVGPDLEMPPAIVCPGTFSHNTDPESIFALLGEWRRRREGEKVRIYHVGSSLGLDPAPMASDCGLGDVYIDKGYVPHRRSIELLCAGDLIIVSVNDDEAYYPNVPGRVYEALRSLRPLLLIAPEACATARIVKRIPGCQVASPGDIRSGCSALDALSSHPRGTPARSVESIRQFDRREQARRLASLCEAVRAERAQEFRQ